MITGGYFCKLLFQARIGIFYMFLMRTGRMPVLNGYMQWDLSNLTAVSIGFSDIDGMFILTAYQKGKISSWQTSNIF